uniref:Uncharacterized protein n=1 Tax=Aegilops tauschii subsp. strangulata TaxID=200361 RepID=A0A453CPU2_AEGTS
MSLGFVRIKDVVKPTKRRITMMLHVNTIQVLRFSMTGIEGGSVAMSTSRSLTNLWRYLHAQRAGTMLMPYEFTP